MLDLEAGKKWLERMYKAWLGIIFIWLKHCIKDQMKDFLSFVFQVSSYRNMHWYVIIQETTSSYNEIYQTWFMLWAQSWKCNWRSAPWQRSTVQFGYKLLSLCKKWFVKAWLLAPNRCFMLVMGQCAYKLTWNSFFFLFQNYTTLCFCNFCYHSFLSSNQL